MTGRKLILIGMSQLAGLGITDYEHMKVSGFTIKKNFTSNCGFQNLFRYDTKDPGHIYDLARENQKYDSRRTNQSLC